ncbi:MAG: DUF2807 domain-containing protein [Muribaculaceae bacterium]|nr:DUF2807 domain-containing protein [Muribaculaceae bacterium]
MFLRIISAALISISFAFVSAAAKYKVDVADFSKLSVDNGVNVIYTCSPDSAGLVVFDCEPDMASKILLINNKSTLRIQIDIDDTIPTGIPTVQVYSAALSYVSNSGDSLVVVNLSVPNDKFTAKVIGNGNLIVNNLEAHNAEAKVTAGRGTIKIGGKTDKAKLLIAGTGRIDAGELRASEVHSSCIGPGHIICRPSVKLAVGGLHGKIYYITEPEEISRRGMGVKALPIDSLSQ